MERFKIFAVLLVSIASAVAVNQWRVGTFFFLGTCERAAYDILTKHFHCTVHSGRGGSGLYPFNFCASPYKPYIYQIKTSCPSLSTASPDSKDYDADAGWYRSMCESPVWAEDEGFRNCTTWTDLYG